MLRLENVSKFYTKGVPILEGICFEMEAKSCVGLVGESGSGKSTLGRLILGLEHVSDGAIFMEGMTIEKWHMSHKGAMSVVFQDYNTSINPRFSIEEALQEPLWRRQKKMRGDELLRAVHRVGLPKRVLSSYAHELSGGQLQRVCLARALVTKPRFLLLDEALSSLDVSIQAQMIALLHEIREETKMSYLFIGHDLQSVSALCERLIVLHHGKIVESLSTQALGCAKHAYTQQLLHSVIPF